MQSGISAALIVRNEEGFLPGCLTSIAGEVDEIVIVDTGSTDRTLDIARSFGATLLHHRWSGDFAEARNRGLEAASGEWILYIDADERLTAPPGRALADQLQGPDTFAARPLFFPRPSFTPYRELRLFRNDPRLRFSQAMHETIVPALDELIASLGATVVEVDATILHLGYEGDLGPKHRRNLPLLRAAVTRTPDRVYLWHQLAETLEALGDTTEALEACRRGLEHARAKRHLGDTRATAPIYVTYANILRSRGKPYLHVVEEGLSVCVGNRALLFLRGMEMLRLGRHWEALAIADGLRFGDGPDFVDPEMSFDKRMFGAHAHELAGLALLRTNRREDAAAAFALAAAAEPEHPSYRIRAIALGRK
jgi:glycosyltransferase involved in cell wall biosynthesis